MLNKICRKFESWQATPSLSIWRTVYFNLRTLPFLQAVRMPLLIYGKIKLSCLDGSVELPVPNTKLKIGFNYAGYRNTAPGRIHLLAGSKLILYPDVKISQGVNISCVSGATLKMKEASSIGDGTDVICYKRITIGHHSGVTWGCQITDFNSHYIMDIASDHKWGGVKTIVSQVVIGDYCWVGNRTTIMPGTRLPNRTIIASNSLLNKDYAKSIPPFSLLAGQPAKLIRVGVKRIYDLKIEQFLSTFFRTSDEKVYYFDDKLEID